MKNNQINAEKLQEVINAKNAEAISKVKEAKATKTTKTTTKKASGNEKPVAEEKKTKTTPASKKETKIEKVTSKVKKNAEVNLVEEVISKREVKYIYPEDCQDTLSRKKFRQQVRNKLHQLELEMLRIEDKASKAFKTKEKEYNSYKNKYIKKGAAA